jgi:3-oxoacyl-[acyl-carrier protein] reductase
MTDRYAQLVNNPIGKLVSKNIGLPQPSKLERYEPGQPVISGPVAVGAAAGSRLGEAIDNALQSIGAPVSSNGAGNKALVFDATGIKDSTQLRELHLFFTPAIRTLTSNGRLLVLGTPPEETGDPREHTAQRALEGFTRSAAKEMRGGGTAQLVYVAPGAEDQIESTLRFLLSPKSAYVSGQVVRIGSGKQQPGIDWERPLAGKVALVTGASRGIGEAIAEVLARDGAHVVGLDVPALEDDLRAVTSRLGGSALALDITSKTAGDAIAEHLLKEHEGADVVVHNAGVTRDKTIAGMKPELWDMLLDINLSSEERINEVLLERDVLRDNGRIVCVSSISGIAGNNGQSNYATSKAGVIGMVQSLAPVVADKGLTINAVAPGFIETQMTAKIPFATREAGRRMNSLSQGGLPVDVAETIAWFASPGSAGISANIVRVCGQSLLGA